MQYNFGVDHSTAQHGTDPQAVDDWALLLDRSVKILVDRSTRCYLYHHLYQHRATPGRYSACFWPPDAVEEVVLYLKVTIKW